MPDPRVEKLAQVVTDYSIEVQPGEQVMISGSTVTAPLIQSLYKSILQAGGHPLIFPTIPGIQETFYEYASEAQLEYMPAPLKLAYDTFDAGISIMGSANTKSLTNVNPEKIKVANQARSEVLQNLLQRMATREYKWLGTIFPTQANAQDAEMSLSEYENFVYGACLPDMEDPVGYWQRFSAWQQKIVDWLTGKNHVHVTGPETDIRMDISGRRFENCDGRENMPAGEVCVSPVETSVEGQVYFSYPGIYMGQEVQGVRLWFENGLVTKASAEKGDAFLQEILNTDEGARRLGELGIGTNEGITEFTRNTLFDEKITGTFHLALGAGLPKTGGQNQSAIHWDIVADLRESGEIWVDEVLIYKNGEFVIDF